MRTGVRVAIIDDHDLFVRGLELLLPAVSDGLATVVATSGDAAYAASVVRHSVPDVILMDLHMPPPGGLHAIETVRRAAPRARILAMSGNDDPAVAIEALRRGANGFLPKSSDAADLLQPLLAAINGWVVLPDELLTALLESDRRHAAQPIPAALDADELDLLRSIAAGVSTIEIATRLHVSERTVKRLTAALLRKLHVSSRAGAAALAGRAGLL